MNKRSSESGEYRPPDRIPRERPGERPLTEAQPSPTDSKKTVVSLDAWGNPMRTRKEPQPIDVANDEHFERKKVATTRPSKYTYKTTAALHDAVRAWEESKVDAEETVKRNLKKWIDTTTDDPRTLAVQLDRPMDDREHDYVDDGLDDEDRLGEPNDLPPDVQIVNEFDHYAAEKRFATAEVRAGASGTRAIQTEEQARKRAERNARRNERRRQVRVEKKEQEALPKLQKHFAEDRRSPDDHSVEYDTSRDNDASLRASDGSKGDEGMTD